jgi:nucleoside 2-deoxyribosyltransferase
MERASHLMKGASALKVFVCGPITEAMNGQELDNGLRGFLELVHETLEQVGMRVLSAHRAEGWGQDEPPADVVAKRDSAWMRDCDASVMVLGTPSRPTWRTDGTFVELGWATALEKPVVVVGDLGAYRSTLVRGLSDALGGIRTLPPEEVQACPELLVRALREAAPAVRSSGGLQREPLQGEQDGSSRPVGQP